jgi:hypothetical protein
MERLVGETGHYLNGPGELRVFDLIRTHRNAIAASARPQRRLERCT